MTKAGLSVEERFWAKVVKGDDCWEWVGARVPTGYGSFGGGGNKTYRAHRLAYELTYGPIPDGILVCHKCDNRLCVRPEHLFLGSHADNSADMVSKGRSKAPRKLRVGEDNVKAKLTEQDIREIRAAYATGEITYDSIAAKYGVSRPTIIYIVRRDTWKHVV